MTQQTFGTTFSLLDNGALRIICSSLDGTILLNVDLPRDDALNNLRVAAEVMGYELVSR